MFPSVLFWCSRRGAARRGAVVKGVKKTPKAGAEDRARCSRSERLTGSSKTFFQSIYTMALGRWQVLLLPIL